MKLDKLQAQAIISKLGREATKIRAESIEREKESYVASENFVKLASLLLERDDCKKRSESALKEASKLSKSLGLQEVYQYTKANDILEKLKNKEIEDKYPKIDLEDALDSLIIESARDDFSVNDFIECYLKK